MVSIWKYIDVVDTGQNLMSDNEVSLWMLLTLVSFVLSLVELSLTASGIQLLWKNIAYIDVIKGVFHLNDKHGLHPNPFDLGVFTNFNTLF